MNLTIPKIVISFCLLIALLGNTNTAEAQKKKKNLAKITVTLQKRSVSNGLLYLNPLRSLPKGYRPKIGNTVILNFGKTKIVALKVLKSTNKKIIGKIVRQYLSNLPPQNSQLTMVFRGKQLKSLAKTVPTDKVASKTIDPFLDGEEYEKSKDRSPGDPDSSNSKTSSKKSGEDDEETAIHREFTIGYRNTPKGIVGAFALNLFGNFMSEFGISRAESKSRTFYPLDFSLRVPFFKASAFLIQPIGGVRYNSTLGSSGAKDKTGLFPLYGLSLQYPRFGSMKLRADFTGDTEDHGFMIGLIWGPKSEMD